MFKIDLADESMLTPEITLTDLREYVDSRGFSLCDSAERIFRVAESIGSRLNVNMYPEIFLIALIEQFPKLRSLMVKRGHSPEDAVEYLEDQLAAGSYDEYSGSFIYSSNDALCAGCRQIYIDDAMTCARKKRRKIIQPADVLEALLDFHDESWPITDNSQWTDERLHVPFNTLSHISAGYSSNLWMSFDDIRRELELISRSTARRMAVRKAPHRLRLAVQSLLSDHPDYLANYFIIMPFRNTQFHSEVTACLRKVLRGLGINPLRADDKNYCDDVMANIETYLYGCRFAVAIHDRYLTNEHNANVAIEVGYFLGMKKPICLLKEQTVEALPSGLQGRIYLPFDREQIETTITGALLKWLRDVGIRMKGDA